MSGPNKVQANIYGVDYTIVGDASEEYIRSITMYVDNRMRELSKVFPNASPLKLAVLSAINITDELFQLKEAPVSKANPELEIAYKEKTQKLISMIDKSLIGD